MHQHDTVMQSPFVMSHEDSTTLYDSKAFRALRTQLAADADFCIAHAQCEPVDKDIFILHRDILHALIMPVVALFLRSSALASAALCSSQDLELAFSGDARTAFLCLQCFITEEKDWCQTKGCPACVVTAILSTESHIRFTIAASLLSMTSTSPSPTPDAKQHRQLPSLLHMLPTLRTALTSDPFWIGADMWPYLLSRATQLSDGCQTLVAECFDLESIVSSPLSEQAFNLQRRRTAKPNRSLTGPGQVICEKGVRLKKSKLAKRQLRLKEEEIQVMRRYALRCLANLQLPKHMRGENLGVSRIRRARSQTCP